MIDEPTKKEIDKVVTKILKEAVKGDVQKAPG